MKLIKAIIILFANSHAIIRAKQAVRVLVAHLAIIFAKQDAKDHAIPLVKMDAVLMPKIRNKV